MRRIFNFAVAGYANEVGEAFRVLVPVSVVRASYGVASGYVLSDAIHKYFKTSQVCFLNSLCPFFCDKK